MSIFRIYVEKKPEFSCDTKGILLDLKSSLKIPDLKELRILNRYDIEGINEETFDKCKSTILSEPPVDVTYTAIPTINGDHSIFGIEYLPGQFDQRADSCAQCIQLITQEARPMVKTARIFILEGKLSDSEVSKIKSYLINPVESREASLEEYTTLKDNFHLPETVETLTGFCKLTKAELATFVGKYGLAMDEDDIFFCQEYFNKEHRDPTITEIRMIDTYWSDHCRHTTFLTQIKDAEITDPAVKASFEKYKAIKEQLYPNRNRPTTLMDIATIGAKKLKRDGLLKDLDESEEINACSVRIKADVNGHDEDWLLQFKNETHNHPTEIEPFGGAATCLGGAIRDPLSGRAYVYQAMRVTGAADPLTPYEDTIKGKLPQKKIVRSAANGYSSYGNQIGLATGHVTEIYHPGYAAKRMEIGAVVGAVPYSNVVREEPIPGDIVILLGGKTGRDGCGGATGSSKSHNSNSLKTCGAEVQKGNAPEERKLQRLFRNPDVAHMIKRCNDFGAGGVSVAIGELADGLEINLDCVSKKYEGLDGTELAISESQERMAVVISPFEVDDFIKQAEKENLEAKVVATVTKNPYLTMKWKGNTVVNISRDFLNSNGAKKETNIIVKEMKTSVIHNNKTDDFASSLSDLVSDLNVCSQRGLVERFDSTIGASSVLLPYGGKYQSTPAQAMAAKIPVLSGETKTASVMGWGYDPFIMEQNSYIGAEKSVVSSLCKVVAAGGTREKCWLTFQEYFERTNNDPERWGKPLSALLGALEAQLQLGIGAIGGKDSMSGTFEDLDVPPTLVSFAISVANTDNIISPEFKKSGNKIVLITPETDNVNFGEIRDLCSKVETAIADKKAVSAWSVTGKGIAEGLFKMCLGNKLGCKINTTADMFKENIGAFILEVTEDVGFGEVIGHVEDEFAITFNGEKISLAGLFTNYNDKLESVFKTKATPTTTKLETFNFDKRETFNINKCTKPSVVIPVFPGTNCEYDTARQFNAAGADAKIVVIKNLTPALIEDSIAELSKAIDNSQIVMIPGGFSGGDEPDGSGKFITSVFRNPNVTKSVNNLLKNRDGLMLGICNGFQALIKLGLVPYGEIVEPQEECPTLTFNDISRHQSRLVTTRIASVKSPWFNNTNVGDVHTVAISHGEGKFVASDELLRKLAKNGQIATQYVDLNGNPTMDIDYNPNGSVYAIEGITSPDGRILGKMAHSERIGDNVYKNVPGNKDQKLFISGVEYFTK